MAIPATSPDFKYRAFISYSHQDQVWGQWLHKALETYRVPSRLVGTVTAAGVILRRLTPIFRDRDELPSAHDLTRKVNEALAQSANLIVICSPSAARSPWVDAEVLAFKRLGRADRVFCVIVGGEPGASDRPGGEAEECFAEALRYTVGADGQLTKERTEPIAADARSGKDGKGNAKLKLIAGMLDVGFDALKQREQQRRNRRMAAITAAALAVMVVTTGLAINAMIARKAAVVARQDAERRQKQAEGLVGFMLGDLNDKLREVHRLDIMQAVDDKAMAYFNSLPSSDVTDEALAQRATALQKIGNVREDQNHLPDAIEAYAAASAIEADLLQRAPGDVARQVAYATSLNWIGEAAFQRGDLGQALQSFRRVGGMLQKAVAAKPDNTEFAFMLGTAHNNVGQVLDARGDIAAAQTEYQAALEIFRKLAAREPKNTRWRSEQGWAWSNLGKLALQQGHLDQAIAAYRADLRIKAALAASDPGNNQWREDLLVSNAILGRTLGLCGEMQAAVRHVSDAVTSARALMAFDPSAANYQDDFALYSQLLGGLLRQQGQLDRAAAPIADAIRVLSALVAKDPSAAYLQHDLAQSQLESAQLQHVTGDADAAQHSAESALAMTKDALAKHTGDRDWTLLGGQVETVLGQIAETRGDNATARACWMQARDSVAAIARTSEDPRFLAAWVSSMLLLDDVDTARPLLAKLAATGYRTPDFLTLVASAKIAYPPDVGMAQRIAAAMN
jgi:tetratricopeptide (TPR) repeat protein